jgi:hypothetical protein
MAYIFRRGNIIRVKKRFQNSDGTFNEKRIGTYLSTLKEKVNEMDLLYQENDPVKNREFMCGTLLAPLNPRDRGILMGLLRDEVDNSQLASGSNQFDDLMLCAGRFRKRANSVPPAKREFKKERKELAKELAKIDRFEKDSRKGSVMVGSK